MITSLQEEQKEQELIEKEQKSIKSYTEIINKHKLKLKLKNGRKD